MASLHSRRSVCFAAVAVAIWLGPAARAQRAADPLPDTVQLSAARLPTTPNAERRVPRPYIWHRELARQAFLLTAREEFGLRTRDWLLGEVDNPANPACFFPEVTSHYVSGVFITITRNGQPVYANTVKTTGNRVRHYLGELVWEEEQTRTGLVAAFEKLGYQRKPHAINPELRIPESAAEQLRRMNPVSQLDALRQIHRVLSEHGESDELLAGLARGYANLTQLTMPAIDTRYAVFGARAMLYAQRIVARNPESPVGYWARAYTMAFVGMPNQTEVDIGTARDKAGANAVLPDWARIADLSWQYAYLDLKQLAKEESFAERELAAFQMFRSTRTAHAYSLVKQAAEDALAVSPDNLCVLSRLFQRKFRVIEDDLEAMYAAQRNLLSRELPRFEGLPDTALTRVPRVTDDPHTVAALARAISNGGRDDALEPSLAAMGETVQAWNLELAMQDAYYHRRHLYWGYEEVVGRFANLFRGHNLEAIFLGIAVDQNSPEGLAAQLGRGKSCFELNALSCSYNAVRMLPEGFPIGNETRETVRSYAHELGGMFEDRAYDLTREHTDAAKVANLHFLQFYAHNSPLYGQVKLSLNWDNVIPEEREIWEAQSLQQPDLLWALARGHKLAGEYEQSIGYYRRYLEFAPDAEIWTGLAEAYYAAGRDEQWMQAAEAALGCEDFSNAHFQLAGRMAGTLMHDGRIAEARPWAERAATPSANGYDAVLLLECLTLQGDLAAVEQMFLDWSEARGTYSPFVWFYWSAESGHGDIDQALAAYQDAARVNSLDPAENYALRLSGVVRAIVAEDEAGALELLRESGGDRLLLSLLADRAGDAQTRDRIWNDYLRAPPTTDLSEEISAQLARFFLEYERRPAELLPALQAWLAAREDRFSVEPPVMTFAGYFLLTREQREPALEALQVAARAGNLQPLRALAWHWLRQHDVDPVRLAGRNYSMMFHRDDDR